MPLTARLEAQEESGDDLRARFHRLTRPCALIAAAIGSIALMGWVLDVEGLRSVIPGAVSMKANTAIGFVLAGTALWVAAAPPSPARRTCVWVFSGVVAVGAAATLVEYAVDVDLGIDGLFDDPATDRPGRPSPPTAAAFLFFAGWLVSLLSEGRMARISSWVLSAAMTLVTFEAFVGYAYGVDYLYGISDDVGVAVHTLLGLAVLAVGLVALRPDRGVGMLFTDPGPAGIATRRMLPPAVLIPLLAGGLFVYAESRDLVGPSDGAAAVVSLAVVLAVAAVALTARDLYRVEAERRVLERRLHALAERDPLTDAFNRRRLQREFEHAQAISSRSGEPLSLAMIDLEGFKSVNDEFGHAVGDRFLKHVAESLQGAVRVTDTVARIGGDEFAVLLPGVGRSTAEARAQELVDAIAATSDGGAPVRLAASAGVAVAVQPAEQLDELTRRADSALYEAKEHETTAVVVA